MAFVPTGMKMGVGTSPWAVWKTPQRAWVLGSCAVMSKWNRLSGSSPGCGQAARSESSESVMLIPLVRGRGRRPLYDLELSHNA